MLPIDPYLGMQIVDQYRREAEHEAAVFRLWRNSGAGRSSQVVRASRYLLDQAGCGLSALGAWLEGQGVAGDLPLDSQVGQSA